MNRHNAVSCLAAVCLALGTSACRHDWREASRFVASLRCGMSEADLRTLAARHGVDVPERSIFRQDERTVTIKPKELDFVDVGFDQGKVVAVQRGNYIAFTTGMEFDKATPLCGQSLPEETRLRDRL